MANARLLSLVLACIACACGPRAADHPATASCREGSAAACERALVSAAPGEVKALVAAYADASGERGWIDLYEALARPSRRAAFVHDARVAPPAGVDALPIPGRTQVLALERVVLALGRGAGRAHVVVAAGGVAHHLFPRDVLAPHTLGLEPMVSGDEARLGDDLALAAALTRAFSAAKRFDYAASASQAERLRALFARGRGSRESLLRARFALMLLDAAGIALRALDGPPPRDPPLSLSSAYAQHFAVQLSPDRAAAWRKRRTSIVPALAPERAKLLDRLYENPSCPPIVLPPMGASADLFFAGALPLALARGKGDGAALAAWLPRYEALVALVDSNGSMWSHAQSVLGERGEVGGLSAGGTKSYARASELGLKHLEALERLAEAHPARFEPLPALALALEPAVLRDRRLGPAAERLLGRAVALKVEAAKEPGEVYDAAFAAIALKSSQPRGLGATDLAALHQALGRKLDGPFGERRGWGLAGLHFGDGLLGWLSGNDRMQRSAPRAIAALEPGPEVSRPALARLAQAAIRYAVLAESQALDPSVSNPKLLSPARRAAREALGRAIAELETGGPTSPRERELAAQLVDLGDGLIAAALTPAAEPKGPSCGGASDGARHEAIERLKKTRRRMIEGETFARATSAWHKRARLFALVVSDGIDLAERDPQKPLAFAVDAAVVERTLDEGLDGWLDRDAAAIVTGTYLVARDGYRREKVSSLRTGARALSALGALARLGAGASESGALGELGALSSAAAAGTEGALGVLTHAASEAYQGGRSEAGDLLLLVVLAASLASDEPISGAASALAAKHRRPLELPLLLHAGAERGVADPDAIERAMRGAAAGQCRPPSAGRVVALRRALLRFRRGERAEARRELDRLLTTIEHQGLVVPRQIFRFEQPYGDVVFNVEQSVSLGNNLLRASGGLGLGLGTRSKGAPRRALTVSFADPTSVEAAMEAGRYYAHAAALAALFHFIDGDDRSAVSAARKAIDAWANGVRLGERRVPSETDRWARDALGTLALCAQLAADKGHPLLAADLWTLLRSGLGARADDAAVRAVLEPVPPALRDIPELVALAPRAALALTTLAAPLACTERPGLGQELERVGCERYPLALSLRVAQGLSVLPRLEARAAGACPTWAALDEFLAVAEKRQYDPDRFSRAVEALVRQGAFDDAAIMLARQRRPTHCAPALVGHARSLAHKRELGLHLRADLVSMAANCDPTDKLDADLALLDELTQRHALAHRNLEVVAFATRFALGEGRYGPLDAISNKPGFVARWLELGPDLGTAALVIHHAASIGNKRRVDLEATAPHYRLLCTTLPSTARGPMCSAIALMRGNAPDSDKQRTARAALQAFLEQATSALRD
jgi:hypothetical protein